MVALLRLKVPHGVLTLIVLALTIAATYGQTIDINWTSAGMFHGTLSAGTVVTIFSSSAPFALTDCRATYTGQGGATRTFGPFEITAVGGDKLFGNVDITNSGPIGVGMNFGSGTFAFTGGTGQFVGATGQGTMDVKTTLLTFPTSSGPVEQQWEGMITLVPATIPGDYNQNGTVDAADYVLWRHTLDQTGPGLAADGDSSGTIDQADYDVWRSHFGQTTGSAPALPSAMASLVAIPEPAAWMMLLMTFILNFSRRPVR